MSTPPSGPRTSPSTVAVRLNPQTGLRVGVALALVIILACLQSVFAATTARAAALTNVFTNVEIIETSAGLRQIMTIDTEWALPPEAVEGDTFSLTLPEEFNWVTSSFEVRDPDTNELVASVTVSGQVATFTVTDYVEAHNNIDGTARFFVEFDQGKVDRGDTVDWSFDTGDTTFTGSVEIPGPGDFNERKEFTWIDNVTQDGFTFAIYADPSPDNIPSSTLEIIDRPGPGVQITCSSIVVEWTDTVGPGGNPGNFQATPSSEYTLTCPQANNPRGFRLEFDDLPASTFVRVSGTATVTDTTLSEYVNGATISLNGETPDRVQDRVRRYESSGEAQGPENTTTTTTTSTTTTSTTTSSTTTSTTSTTTSTSSTTPPSSTSSTSTLPQTGAPGTLPTSLVGAGLLAVGLLFVGLSAAVVRIAPSGRYRR